MLNILACIIDGLDFDTADDSDEWIVCRDKIEKILDIVNCDTSIFNAYYTAVNVI